MSSKVDEYYFTVKITVSGRRFFLLWNAEYESVFLTDDKKDILVFTNLFNLTSYAKTNGIDLEDGITPYDLDNITITAGTLDCKEITEKWNIISDLALTAGLELLGEDKRYHDIYDKLFFGCDLPAMNHPSYTPKWSAEEIAEINRTLAADMFYVTNAALRTDIRTRYSDRKHDGRRETCF